MSQVRSAGRPRPAGGMLLRELLLLLLPHCCWPPLPLALHPLRGFIQITQGEPQKSCSKAVAEKVTESCQQICQCRPPPPLPPPPPPPPPPRLLVVPTTKSTYCPPEGTWWPGLIIIIAVCCATLVFLIVVVIICYKAIKRKPLRKEENGTNRAEYAMTSSQNNKTVDNNAVV
ncbi:proline-rich membrane anchor 1 isoform X2 [Alligator sinensis]|uniref:Proline-rich membrane anchor 1 isoform X2 n=1 Tax=Alligator sinensis TaxID=38654 RepID=A0A3Q0GRQ6_ALLSI|nr:proline-rich membrane anchor 1 isoform X2 [Alligator sinensis]